MVEYRRSALTIQSSLMMAMLALPVALGACGSDAADPTSKSSGQSRSEGDDDESDDDESDDDDTSEPKPSKTGRDGGKTSSSADGGTTPVKRTDAGSDTKQAGVPCEVAKVLETHCAECHGDPPNWGGPMSLVDHDDFHIDGKITKTKKVDELVLARINDEDKPMPPNTAEPMPEADRATLEAWLKKGAPAGTDDDSCVVKTPDPKEDTGGEVDVKKDWPDAVCYDLKNHGKPTPNDTSKYPVKTGEHYAEFFFDAPWKEPSVMVGFKTLADDSRLLHHWLMYKTNGNQANGSIGEGIGSHIGQQVQLLAGWALGGSDISIPKGIAAVMPPPGGKIMVEWHYYNPTGQMQMDASGVQVCVVPASKVEAKNVASLTWVGNENLGGNSLLGVVGVAGMPPQKESKAQDVCTPKFAGLPPGEPVRIFSFTPHMHKLGRHMRTWVARKDGKVEKIFDEKFQFDHQISYNVKPMIEIFPGDKLVNECTFFNDTNKAVGFGPSSDQEMCYQFTYAYPANALVNGVSSLTGATNTCWDNKPADAARYIGMSAN